MKRVCIASLLVSVFLLSGCTFVDEQLEKEINSNSLFQDEIQNDPDFQQYQKLNIDGKLDSDGVYIDRDYITSTPNPSVSQGQVHVTFATNRYLKIKYYSDADLTKEINQDECFLNPGDTIFATVESENINSNLYRIAKFIIIEYNSEGVEKAQYSQKANSSKVFSIPMDFSGTELSIIPIGEYPDRKLSMRVFYIDNEDCEKDLASAGQWSINGESCTGNQASISPIVPYVLRFDFDKENYFFVSSTPVCFTDDPNHAGFVEFWAANPTDNDIEYAVQLHKYLHLGITMEEEATVVLNNGKPETIKKGKTWSSNLLRFGDVITIETAGSCTLSSGEFAHVHAVRDPILGGYRYTLKIVQTVESGAADILRVNEYLSLILPKDGQHGTCTYKIDGETVSGEKNLQLSQKLEITYTITDSDYKFGDTSILGGIWNFGQDLFANMSQTVTIPLTPDMNNTSINPDEWFNIVKKGS